MESNDQLYACGFAPTKTNLNSLSQLNTLISTFPLPQESLREKFTKSKDLQRLLLAREYNATKSFEMWKKWVEWRIKYKVDELNPTEFLADLKSGKAFYHKLITLQVGQVRPFMFDRSSNNQFSNNFTFQTRKHIPKETTVNQMMQFGAYIIEEGVQAVDARTEGNGQMVCIWDRAGQTTKNFDKRMFTVMKSLVHVLQDNYAERLHTVFVLNPNWFFRMMYAIVSPFFSQKTKDKYKLIKDMKVLKQYFDEDCLLKEHGGTSDFVYDYKLPNESASNDKIKEDQKEEVNNGLQELDEEENKYIEEQLQKAAQEEQINENQ